MYKTARILAVLIGMALWPAVASAQSSAVVISKLGALTSDARFKTMIKPDDQFWGIAAVENTGDTPELVGWSMTLDGAQISYGGWNLTPGREALFTSIDSSVATPGEHTLTLTVYSGETVIAESSTRLMVPQH